jgi:hypothetical protein
LIVIACARSEGRHYGASASSWPPSRGCGSAVQPTPKEESLGLLSEDVVGDYGAIGGAAGEEIDRFDPALRSPVHTLVLASSEGHGRAMLRITQGWPLQVDEAAGNPPLPHWRRACSDSQEPGSGSASSSHADPRRRESRRWSAVTSFTLRRSLRLFAVLFPKTFENADARREHLTRPTHPYILQRSLKSWKTESRRGDRLQPHHPARPRRTWEVPHCLTRSPLRHPSASRAERCPGWLARTIAALARGSPR